MRCSVLASGACLARALELQPLAPWLDVLLGSSAWFRPPGVLADRTVKQRGIPRRRALLAYLNWTRQRDRVIARTVSAVMFGGLFLVVVRISALGAEGVFVIAGSIAVGAIWQAGFFWWLEKQGVVSREEDLWRD